MRVLVCGDRYWDNEKLVYQYLDRLHEKEIIDCVIDGHATGADQMGHAWADKNGVDSACYRAQWQIYGPAAGPIRNSQMQKEGKPDLVLAFHNNLWESSRGTQDMVKKAMKAGIPVRVIKERKRES